MTSSCGRRAREEFLPEEVKDEWCPFKRRRLGDPDMPHNGRGHVYMSRFLGTAIPNKMLKAHPQVVPAYLQELKSDLSGLFNQGVECEGHVYRAALIGVKGDFEYHLEVTNYSRSYTHEGPTNPQAFCPECMAGSDESLPGIDLRDPPAWLSSLYTSDPWSVVPPLSEIPFSESKKATLYRRDAFHTLKHGFLRDLCASCIIWLAHLRFFDSPGDSWSLATRLERAHSSFHLYCLACKKSPSLRKFTKANFHRHKANMFPFLSGKGADTLIVLEWLRWFIKLLLREPRNSSNEILMAMLQTAEAALNYTGVASSHNILIHKSCAKYLLRCGFKLLKGYAFLASKAMSENRRLFSLRPKVHFYHHFLIDLQEQIRAVKEQDEETPCILNYAAIFNCEANEDMIGKIARVYRAFQ
ncbi:unnamed protein product [Symbiodinium natans]|uniref:Uncharacterized protein n=1 Tax=Symbiodinium natans TaxID=878477 RepID=A0A812UY74_9DINO|nr:unnamed protein product [Symbiodinium natans]